MTTFCLPRLALMTAITALAGCEGTTSMTAGSSPAGPQNYALPESASDIDRCRARAAQETGFPAEQITVAGAGPTYGVNVLGARFTCTVDSGSISRFHPVG